MSSNHRDGRDYSDQPDLAGRMEVLGLERALEMLTETNKVNLKKYESEVSLLRVEVQRLKDENERLRTIFEIKKYDRVQRGLSTIQEYIRDLLD